MLSYLERLTLRLAAGVAALPEEFRQRQAAFFLDRQQPDGGFTGREGGSDLYYTGFGLRGLAVLGQLDGAVAERAADFLASRLHGRESIVDFFSLIYGAKLLEVSAGIHLLDRAEGNWRGGVEQTLESLRAADGGYAKGPGGAAGSTYHTFLVLLCRELIERPVADPERVVSFLMGQFDTEGGGFREIRVSKRAGTNPTAAAIGALIMLDEVRPEVRELTLDFLVEMQTDEGGLRANTRIPIADVLSTFTGLVTLIDLSASDELDLAAVRRFVTSLACEEGGFLGAAWDEKCDVEYSFYALGTLGLLENVMGAAA